jgi:thiol:disulfide interchange protein
VAANNDADLDAAPVSTYDSGNNITASAFYQILALGFACPLVLTAVVSSTRPT